MFKKFSLFFVAAFCFTSVFAAQLPNNISPQQIEQFKRLPLAQQKALARSMGVDFDMLKSQLQNGSGISNKQGQTESLEQEYYPRGTMFDAMGNPILGYNDKEENLGEKAKLKPFGYEVFANAPQTFAPNTNIVIPDDYVIGAGDSIAIQMFGKENRQIEATVNREGLIAIANIGAFNVAGMSFIEMKKFLASELKNRVLGVEVITTLSNVRSIRVLVVGEAYKPGPYILNGLSSITHAIFAAGGFSDIGSLRNIALKRNGKLITHFDAYKLLMNGDSSQDVMLKTGDVIVIEPAKHSVTVEGEVRRPGIYEIKGGESYSDVIALAGGLLPTAYITNTSVQRFEANNAKTILTVDLSDKALMAEPVATGDMIRISKTPDSYAQSVTLIGAVSYPGKYQWKDGLRVRDLLKDIRTDLLDEADLNYSLIVREKRQTRDIELIQFSMINVASNTEAEDNFVLQPHDSILVFSRNELIENEHTDLESFAVDKKQLLDKERELAIQAYRDNKFWMAYGKKTLEQNDQDLLANVSLQDITETEQEEKIDIREVHPFSRKRLLMPVIEKLRRQATVGTPVQLVEIVGSVKYPGVYPLTVNQSVRDLVLAGGGLLESAYLTKAELTRSDIVDDNATKQSMLIGLSEQMSKASTVKLQSKDRLNILRTPSWQENLVVELRGEFKFPGKYTIRRGETLRELIERVGGFTEYAHLKGSVFTREKLKEMEKRNLVKIAESLRMEIASKSLAQNKGSNIDYSQAKLLLSDLTKIQPVGRLVVELDNMTKDNQVYLEDGDVLYVPTIRNSINVIGQVQVATSHLFDSKLSLDEYVGLSGGVKQQADVERIYVIKANGSVTVKNSGNWFSSNDVSALEPGDTIVVPLDSDYMDRLTLWSTGTQIIYQAAVAIAAISGI